ncbi:hypothetical protein HYPSUDRAFT_176652 [Hypholoma sublateritium FD-334 SS-4]|uniref:Cyanovirin-N domain-containing protein n=1 Tax=Hypholoma sublateritium (strain FD-334 SS-4) TaxID=945553 RepID=A0A0D2LLG2_HYPSF|nr:hypothetical protein HYPSUDRAFT_176652 [Hypholoma sublateritium FD-334 SS-4]
MQLTTTFIAVFATAFAAFRGAEAQGFGVTCTNPVLSGSILTATCGNGHGGQTNSALDLNACVGLSGGNLVCQSNGDFLAHGCTGCSLIDVVISCDCPGFTFITLDECVTNDFGLLTCS